MHEVDKKDYHNLNHVHMKLEIFHMCMCVCVCVCVCARVHAHVTQLNKARWQKKVTKNLLQSAVWINTYHLKVTYRAGLVYTIKSII